jgi:aminopeptidase-like protein
MVDFLDVRLQQDPEYLLLRDDTLSTMPTMVTFDMMEGIQELFKYDRQLTGEGFNDALDYLSQFVPLRIHNWVGGDKCWTWTIPEGGLRLGEYIVKGFGNETIILPIHLDHSGMANDNLSGVAVAMKLIDMLQRTPDLKYSYKFLFVPETIGTIAYLSMFGYRYKYGIVIDSVGTTGDIVVTQSKMLSKLNMYIENKTNTFLSDEHLNTGNDERVLESVGIPSIQVSRSPFKEYHTKDDTPDIIDEPKLYGALFITYDIIKRMERDFRPCPTYTGVPCLSAYDLWQPDINLEKIYHMLTYRLYISEIAGTTGLPFDFIYDFVMKMREKGLC